jgi:hypothetical protein
MGVMILGAVAMQANLNGKFVLKFSGYSKYPRRSNGATKGDLGGAPRTLHGNHW